MGYRTAERYIDIDRATTAEDALYAAVYDWERTEADRYDKPCTGDPTVLPLMAWAAVRANRSGGRGAPAVGPQSSVVPVCDSADTREHVLTTEIVVTSEQLAALQWGGNAWMLASEVRAQFGDTVTAVELVSAPEPHKPVATVIEGEPVTMYRLMMPGTYQDYEFDKARYKTEAGATRAAIKAIERNGSRKHLVVVAEVTRGAGSHLVSVARPAPEPGPVTVDVTTSVPCADAKQVGWMVSFTYSR